MIGTLRTILVRQKKVDMDPLKEHELAKKLVGHELAKNMDETYGPGNITRLDGYVGPAPSKDVVRLYLNDNFDECIDVPRKSILHAVNAPEDVLRWGGTTIWIKNDVQLEKISY